MPGPSFATMPTFLGRLADRVANTASESVKAPLTPMAPVSRSARVNVNPSGYTSKSVPNRGWRKKGDRICCGGIAKWQLRSIFLYPTLVSIRTKDRPKDSVRARPKSRPASKPCAMTAGEQTMVTPTTRSRNSPRFRPCLAIGGQETLVPEENDQ